MEGNSLDLSVASRVCLCPVLDCICHIKELYFLCAYPRAKLSSMEFSLGSMGK